mmetsp:Transcript_19754/g.27775  ORF Transcript_19754/g.27775 Transcript_19754/m.27775 type:complete len:98 (+) Transcript_19754:892-1185(+)
MFKLQQRCKSQIILSTNTNPKRLIYNCFLAQNVAREILHIKLIKIIIKLIHVQKIFPFIFQVHHGTIFFMLFNFPSPTARINASNSIFDSNEVCKTV